MTRNQRTGRGVDGRPGRRYEITDDGYARIKELLPVQQRGGKWNEHRTVLNGIFWVLRSGAPWRDLPDRYGPRTTCYNRFVRWAAKGVWVDTFQALASAGGPPAQVLIDSSAVKAHRCASGGRRGGEARICGIRREVSERPGLEAIPLWHGGP